MPSRARNAVALLGAVLLCAVAFSARAAKVWETLPPMPQLPPHTVGNYLEVDGARTWYAEWGRKSALPPVLLLHGGFGNSNYFGLLIPVLVQHGYYVIAMDSRGH